MRTQLLIPESLRVIFGDRRVAPGYRGRRRIPDDYVDFFEKGGFLSVPIFEYLEGRFVV